MKCPKCNGTGIDDDRLICYECDGTGEYEPFDADIELDKLYPTELTNEEWLQSLNTEQLAEFLNAIIRVAPYDELEPKSFWEHLHPYDGGKKGIVEWLKQPHKE